MERFNKNDYLSDCQGLEEVQIHLRIPNFTNVNKFTLMGQSVRDQKKNRVNKTCFCEWEILPLSEF